MIAVRCKIEKVNIQKKGAKNNIDIIPKLHLSFVAKFRMGGIYEQV